MSADLHIYGTEDTPEVVLNFEIGSLSISGNSYPENPFAFYKPILEKISSIEELADRWSVNIRLNYFNSGSTRFLLELLTLVKSKSSHFELTWHYGAEDDIIKERGEELSAILDIPFEFVKTV